MATATATATAPFIYSRYANSNPKASIFFIRPRISHSTRTLFSNFQFSPARKCLSAVQDYELNENLEKTLEKKGEEEEEEEKRRKLFVVNLPWDFSAPDIEKLFGECGTVKDVEIIKKENRKNRGFAFITMASGEEAKAVVEKFDSFELMERIIRVEFAKSFKKFSPPQPGAPKADGRYKIYASNLAWKVRSTNLRNLFAEKFKPVSARVVFDSASGKSAGYGFVGFATMEEAEAAVSELDGKELLGRSLRLKVSQKPVDASGEETEDSDDSEQQSEES